MAEIQVSISNKLPENLELQYLNYARNVSKGHTMTRREWLEATYPGHKIQWR